MIDSRDLKDLNKEVRLLAEKFLLAARKAGYNVLVTSTFRDAEKQNDLYAQGRTKPGKRVTNARAGFSWHNFRCAFDIVPLDDRGRADWDNTDAFMELGRIGREAGLEWGGDWKSFVDLPHFQFTNGLNLGQLRAKYGKEAPPEE